MGGHGGWRIGKQPQAGIYHSREAGVEESKVEAEQLRRIVITALVLTRSFTCEKIHCLTRVCVITCLS